MSDGFIRALIVSVALAGGSVAATAQTGPSDDSSTITVIGERNSKQRIADFVRALAPVKSGQQLSRFERSVCPSVSGLPLAQEQAVARRIRTVARSIGIAVGGTRCDPNLVVVVTPDKAAFLEQLRKHRPEYFEAMTRHEIAQVLRQPGPAAAWQLAGPKLNARGVEIRSSLSSGVPINRTTDPGSRITAAARPQFGAAIVVVEQGALAGLTTTQLADYAAMRALAKTDPSQIAQSSAPTILRILGAPMGTPVPVTLTNWDFGFLRGLYTADPNISARAQRSAIAETVGKRIEGNAVTAATDAAPRRD